MQRRDFIRFFPLSIASTGIAGQAFAQDLRYKYPSVDIYRRGMQPPPGETVPAQPMPLAIQYTSKIRDMLIWIKETQSENLLEASYVIANCIMKKRTCWYHWDMGHSLTFDLFPERNGSPEIFTVGYNAQKAKAGDLFLANVWSGSGEEVKKKGVLLIGGPAPWGSDARNAQYIVRDSAKVRLRPYSDIWIELNVDTIGAIMDIPGMPAPIGPVSGVIGMVTYWMMVADVCRILARNGKSLPITGDEPELSGDTVPWVSLYDPLMDDYFEQFMLQMEMLSAELGDMRRIAKMAVDTVLDGGMVYCYSRYAASLSAEASTRRGGLAMTRGIHMANGKLSLEGGSSKDMVIMGTFQPDDPVDLQNLDIFRSKGMKVASLGPMTRNIAIPEGRCVHKETDVHVGLMCDTYGLYAVPGFKRKVCPTSGAMLNQIFWATCMEMVEEVKRQTGGNVPGIFFSAATRGGTEHMIRMHQWREERGY